MENARSWPESRLVRIGAVLLALFACWWSTLGADLSDDAHNIALAWRLSLGDAPFVDEMNTQATGAFLAVPFTWLWTQLFGVSGLVLASRLFFVAVAFGVGYLAYRALRTTLRPATAAVAVAAPLMALPYHLGQISYNTMPILGLVLATTAGFAAVLHRDRRWAAIAGAAAAIAVVSFPMVVLGGVLILVAVTLLSRRRNIVAAVVLGGLAVSVPVGLWLLLGVGPSRIGETLRFTLDYQALRVPVSERGRVALDAYTFHLGLRKYWPMWAAAAIAAIPLAPPRIRALAAAGVPVLAAAPGIHHLVNGVPGPAFGKIAGVYAITVSLALLVPVSVWAYQRRRQDIGVLICLSLPAALVTVPLLASTTSSGVGWGVHVIGGSCLFMTLVAGWCEMVAEPAPRARILGCAFPVVIIGLLLTFTPFKDGPPWQATTRITTGPFAGITTDAGGAARIDETAAAAQWWVEPDDGVLLYGLAGDYLLTRGHPVTNIMWLGDFGEANRATLDYFERTGRTPDVVLVNHALVDQAGGYEQLADRDPLIAYIVANYHVVDPEASVTTVLRRN
ncbi:MAG: hypothetical protein ACRDWI_05465 [Jiangellaceae bacterium]